MQCDKLCGDGQRSRKVTCHRKVDDKIQALNDTDCEGDVPARTESCFLRPCEGVDWITTDWSGCKSKCGLEVETRRAQCVSPKGKAYADEFCHAYRKPDLTRPCADAAPCEFSWYASQWSDCSADCGTGIKTRKVFCGTMPDDTLTKVDDSKCDAAKKYENTTECTAPADNCTGVWFAGPWSEVGPPKIHPQFRFFIFIFRFFLQCSKSCATGSRTRAVLCLVNNETTSDLKLCGVDTIPFAEEKCNVEPCSEVPTTEAPKDDLIEVCEEVETDEYEDEEESAESSSTTSSPAANGTTVAASPTPTGGTTASPSESTTVTTASPEALMSSTTSPAADDAMSGSGDGDAVTSSPEGSGEAESVGLFFCIK